MADDEPHGEGMYREHILDHYKRPRNQGKLEKADAESSALNPLCGDEITIQIQVRSGRITDIKFQGTGCAISQAAVSMITEQVKGRRLAEVKQALSKEEMLELLGIPISQVRLKCALLSLDVLNAAIARYEQKVER